MALTRFSPIFDAFDWDLAPVYSPVSTWAAATYQRGFADEAAATATAERVKATGVKATIETEQSSIKKINVSWQAKPVAEKVLAALQESQPNATINDVIILPGTQRYDPRFAERVETEVVTPVYNVTVKVSGVTRSDLAKVEKAVYA